MLIVERRGQGWKQAHIAAALGVPRKTVRYWLARFATEGEAGLHDRSSRPHRCPTKTPPQVEARVVALRRAERRGRDQIAAELAMPARTVSRILARHHMPHLAVLNPMTGERLRASKTTAVRYEHDRPGELVHMDVKKLGRMARLGPQRLLMLSRWPRCARASSRSRHSAPRTCEVEGCERPGPAGSCVLA